MLIDGAADPEVLGGEPEPRPGRWRRGLRPFRDLGLFVAVVAAALILARDEVLARDGSQGGAPAGADQPAVAAPAPTSPSPPGATTPPPRRSPDPLLVAPATVEPGETVSIVAYRPRGLCGGIELRWDGVRLDHHVTAIIEAPHPQWNSVLLTVRIPAASPAPDHQLELIGPVPGAGRGGVRCGDRDQRVGRIATASVTVAPRSP